ncbi:MAG: hypothetical protein U0791_15940 [Gemmataceae bacterium]
MRILILATLAIATTALAQPGTIDIEPKPGKLDYDIVYVRMPRKGDKVGTNWTEISNPTFMDAGADLMLLHADGREEVLVKGSPGSVTDPTVSFDGEWVYYSKFHDLKGASVSQGPAAGADIFKIHVKSRKIVQLTKQEFTPNTGAADWSKDFRTPAKGTNHFEYGVFNMGPCPLPGGKVMFTSNRNGFRPPKRLPHVLQLFTMDDDGTNVECIGHLNLGMALHPTMLMDGRVMFSSLESQGLRASILWGLWSIHPDGTNWGPLASAFLPGPNPTAYHFQTQLSDGSIVAEEYYNQTSSGFGSFVKFPAIVPNGQTAFGPGFEGDPRNPELAGGRLESGVPRLRRIPFSPFGIESITRFARPDEGQADPANGRRFGPRVGKVTHPSGGPNNDLLAVWSPGPVNGGYTVNVPAIDSGLYVIKGGKPIDEPGQMMLIKNDPKFNEHWPRALVPYERIYGVKEPKALPRLANDGKLSPHLPAGTPFGLVGTSSLYKRESYPNGGFKKGEVTASFVGADANGYEDLDPFNTAAKNAGFGNWFNQGADAGRYANDDIHAIRILAMEPTTDRNKGPHSGRPFRSHANERLRILGEIPVRKFAPFQPRDPDGNPDTSFLAKIPADVGFTFQTLDKNGMVLNMAQTWHQVRPGEIRNDCGGCHAHSQKPTLFEQTAAAKNDYAVFDLTAKTPLLTTKAQDESKKKWDAKDETGLRYSAGVKDVEYFRDIQPIFERSCARCHTGGFGGDAAGEPILDDKTIVNLPDCDDVPGTYYRLAMDSGARFGIKPINGAWRHWNASRYIRMFQSRRSLLVWKIYGKRLDGWSNDDFPTETVPGDPNTLALKGVKLPNTPENRNRADLDFTGKIMPPPDAVKNKLVEPLTDEDRLTIVRWIDLGCPIDLDKGRGWLMDDQRPTLAVTVQPDRLLIGAYDYAGLDEASLTVTADFAIEKPRKTPQPGVWEVPLTAAPRGKLLVSVKDKQGHTTRIERLYK